MLNCYVRIVTLEDVAVDAIAEGLVAYVSANGMGLPSPTYVAATAIIFNVYVLFNASSPAPSVCIIFRQAVVIDFSRIPTSCLT